MFKTASKFLFGLAAMGIIAAGASAFGTGGHKFGMDSVMGPLTMGWKGYVGDHVGYSVLFGLAVVALFAGILLTAVGEADAESAAQVLELDAVPDVPAPATVNYWPVVGAFSVAALALGLAVGPTVFAIGLIGLAATTVEWAVRAWSDRATGDPEVNAAIRHRMMNPVEIPVGAALVIGLLVLSVSRVLLALPKGGSYVVFGLVPALILAFGLLIALRPRMSSSAIAAILIVAGLSILGAGIAAGIHGEREHGGEHEEEGDHEGAAPLPAPAHTIVRVGA